MKNVEDCHRPFRTSLCPNPFAELKMYSMGKGHELSFNTQ